jgi:hypothetical protein
VEPSRFDELARLLSGAGNRRAALGAMLGILVGPSAAEAIARKRGKSKERGNDRNQNRDRNQSRDRLQTERRGKTGTRRKKHKKKRGRGNNDGGQTPPPPPADCCGTKSCPPPESGSTRAACNFAGRSFVGQDHNGSTFRGIDGREAVFTATHNHGSIFAEACLQGARFRRARLDGSTWGDACLFDADFTGADFRGDLTLFDNARFCNTLMPDGSINDRDCGRATACCQATPGPSCQSTADCADQECQTTSCQNGQCRYSPVVDGPDPAGQCAVHCCEGVCCNAGATECNALGLCCVPNCTGRTCGPDGCDGSCGTCPTGLTCNDNGRCVGNCRPQNCANGCCDDDGVCQPGNTAQNCGAGGQPCLGCSGQETCQNGECVACSPSCQPGQRCNANGRCVCDDESCPHGCCDGNETCQPGGANGVCGSGGRACQNCQQLGDECVAGVCVCTLQSCPNGCCDEGPGNPGRCFPNQVPLCGVGGELCVSCTGNNACDAQGQCVCSPNCVGKTCGPDGCGGVCGTCRPGETCTATGQCRCTANSCPSGQQCCGGRCGLPNGNVCCQSSDCCSGTCFNYHCVDQVATCAGNDCDEPSNGCAGEICCGDPATINCGDSCCGPPATVCNADDGGCSSRCGSPGSPCCQNGQCCDGVCCDGVCCGPQGECRNGQCVCIPKTCAELGRTCGTAPDGCGGTLECGTCPIGATPSCKDGTCVSCPTLCPSTGACLNFANGDSACCNNFEINCGAGCSSNANCTDPNNPLCLVSFTSGGEDSSPNQTTTIASICGGSPAAICTSSLDQC